MYSFSDADSPAAGVEAGHNAAGGVVALDHGLGGEHVHVDHVEVDHAGGGPPRGHQVARHVAVRDVALGSGQGLKSFQLRKITKCGKLKNKIKQS